jgi:hypothetical protein
VRRVSPQRETSQHGAPQRISVSVPYSYTLSAFFPGEERAAQKGEPIDIGTGKDSLRETGIEREIPELRE